MTGKVLTLRRPDTCVGCGAALDAGSRAGWDAASRTVSCLVCISSESVDPIASGAEPPSDAAPVDRGVGGGSAQLEFDRRHAARRDRVLSNHPRIGPVLLALFDDASSTKVWAQGAAGERAVAARLDAVEGALVLHDRRLRRPDGRLPRANIDHLAIVPTGVWVIDAKTHRGRLEVLRMGGLRSPRVERLRINGRDQTALVDGDVLPDLPVSGAMCFVGTGMPWFDEEIDGIALRGRRGLAKLLGRSGPIGPEERAAAHRRLAEVFPPA